MDVLQELKTRRLLGELARRLRPRVTRQAIQKWKIVPYRYLRQVATMTGVNPALIRPDRADIVVLWEPPWSPPRARGELDLRDGSQNQPKSTD
jgi:hypothetical protein